MEMADLMVSLFLLLAMNVASQITIVQLGYNYMHIFSAKDTEALFVSFILSLLKQLLNNKSITPYPPSCLFKTLNSKSHNSITQNRSALTHYKLSYGDARTTYPSRTNASMVLPSSAPCLNTPISAGSPNAARRRPASLTDATSEGTADCFLSNRIRYDNFVRKDRKRSGRSCKHTKVDASRITPNKFLLFAKLTASLTLRHLTSDSSSRGAGISRLVRMPPCPCPSVI